ncbi:MAG: MarC family protein [Candidatus Methanogranum gryphiswaldense]|jgi:multiple antibiotic resistance protein|nr:MAG: MarC family protein [Candidatus Methanogranum sp. U3.2.1]
MISIQEAVIFAIGLAVLFSPPATIGPYLSITSAFDEKTQKKIARTAALYYFIFVIAIAWIGQYALEVLGISVNALMATGGIILLVSSIPMVLGKNYGGIDSEQIKHSNWKTVAAVPIVFPLACGGGSIALIISNAMEYSEVSSLILISAMLLLVSLVVFLTFIFAEPLAKKAGNSGLEVMSRAGGIILATIALQMLVKGLVPMIYGYWPG